MGKNEYPQELMTVAYELLDIWHYKGLITEMRGKRGSVWHVALNKLQES